jgi:nicotinamidase-related amidase
MPKNYALIIVDMQNDMMDPKIYTGAVEKKAGVCEFFVARVLEYYNAFVLVQFGLVIVTQDWHPRGHVSFRSTHLEKRPESGKCAQLSIRTHVPRFYSKNGLSGVRSPEDSEKGEGMHTERQKVMPWRQWADDLHQDTDGTHPNPRERNDALTKWKREDPDNKPEKYHEFIPLVYTNDHAETKKVQQRIWPDHCIQNTDGARLIPQLLLAMENEIALHPARDHTYILKKGADIDVDGCSAVMDALHEPVTNKLLDARASLRPFSYSSGSSGSYKSTMRDKLSERSITDVYCVGLDVGVFETARDLAMSLPKVTVHVLMDATLNFDTLQQINFDTLLKSIPNVKVASTKDVSTTCIDHFFKTLKTLDEELKLHKSGVACISALHEFPLPSDPSTRLSILAALAVHHSTRVQYLNSSWHDAFKELSVTDRATMMAEYTRFHHLSNPVSKHGRRFDEHTHPVEALAAFHLCSSCAHLQHEKKCLPHPGSSPTSGVEICVCAHRAGMRSILYSLTDRLLAAMNDPPTCFYPGDKRMLDYQSLRMMYFQKAPTPAMFNTTCRNWFDSMYDRD